MTVYQERLAAQATGQVLQEARLKSHFLLRSVQPPLAALHGMTLRSVGRIGKRLVIEWDDEVFAVFHLMIAGRLRWRPPQAPLSQRAALMAWDFENGTLLWTEAGSK